MDLNNCKFIDLSQEIYAGMPINIGFPETEQTILRKHEDEASEKSGFSFYIGNFSICEHSGSHVDAISHIDSSKNAPHINEMELNYFMGRAIAVDFEIKTENEVISANDIKFRLNHYDLKGNPGDVFLYTYGHYKKYYKTDKYITACSGLSGEATEYLLKDLGIKNIGTDGPSIDQYGNPNYPAHAMCKKHKATNTEHLCNIEKVVGQEFFYIGLPLKIRHGSGSPIRAVAITKEKTC